MNSCEDPNSYNAIKEFEKAKKFVGEMLNAQSSAELGYTHYNANEGEWLGMPRNKYGFESIFDDPENRQHIREAIGAPAPQIPYLFWPLAIVGALVFAHVVNGMCSAKR